MNPYIVSVEIVYVQKDRVLEVKIVLPDSYFESKLEQNQKFKLLKSGAKSELDT